MTVTTASVFELAGISVVCLVYWLRRMRGMRYGEKNDHKPSSTCPASPIHFQTLLLSLRLLRNYVHVVGEAGSSQVQSARDLLASQEDHRKPLLMSAEQLGSALYKREDGNKHA